MSEESQTEPIETDEVRGPKRPRVRLWFLPIIFLVAIWLWLAFRSGGFLPQQWLVPALAVAGFALVFAWLGAYPRRPRQLSLAILGLLLAYGAWVVASAAWAGSVQEVWEEAGRTFFYLLVLGIAFTYLTDHGARSALRYLLLGAGLLLVLAVTYQVWQAPDLALFFTGRRFSYPASYPNNAAALYLVLFWPLLWVAADPKEIPTFRGAALGTCTGLVGLAILTQSRGGLYALALSVVLVFLLSPVRLRTLFFLVAPATLTIWYFPRLNQYWSEGPADLGGGPAANDIIIGVIVAAGVGVVVAHLEQWIHVSDRMRAVFGGVVVALAVVLGSLGAYQLEKEVGDVPQWLSDSWEQFRAEEQVVLPSLEREEGSAATSRLAMVSASGRWDIWRVGWDTFLESPVAGVGAGNYVYEYQRERRSRTAKPRQPHSLQLRVLSETGAVGGTLFFGAILLGLAGIFWPRFSAAWHGVIRRRGPEGLPDETRGGGREPPPRWHTDPKIYAWEMYLAFGFLYWLIHGSVEWLWHMPGVSMPALLMFALGVAWTDARAETLWPRLSAALHQGGQLRALLPGRGIGSSRELKGGETAERDDPPEEPGSGDTPLSPHRRSDRYAARRRRRSRRETRRERLRVLRVPPGPLSVWFRRISLLAALAVLIGTLLPYASLRVQQTARAKAGNEPSAGISDTYTAGMLQPFSPSPIMLRARIYEDVAVMAAQTGDSDPESAVLDHLALALATHEEAIDHEPVAWQTHHHAGVAVLDLLAARTVLDRSDAAEAVGPLIRIPGVEDWPALTGQPVGGQGTRGVVLPIQASERMKLQAERLLGLDRAELVRLAQAHLESAQTRNPLSPTIAAALAGLDEFSRQDF